MCYLKPMRKDVANNLIFRGFYFMLYAEKQPFVLCCTVKILFVCVLRTLLKCFLITLLGCY